MVVDPGTLSLVAPPAAVAYLGYKAYKSHSKKRKEKHRKREAQAQFNLDMLQDALDQGGSYDEMVSRIAKGYQGKANQLPQFLEQNKHLLITGLLKTDAAKELMDTQGFMNRTYAPGVADIETGARQAARAGSSGLAMSGLSAAGVGSAMAAQTRLGAGAAKGNLYANLMNQHLNARYGMQRDVAGMAMGFPPSAPTGGGGGTDWSGIAMGAGQIAATIIPSLFPSGGGGAAAPRAAPKTGGQGPIY